MQISEPLLRRQALLLEAYATLNRTTPLGIDCGLLCGQRCCQSEDGESGMLLLPGEDALLVSEQGYQILRNDDQALLLCSSTCARDMRPFACRIFPLFPLVSLTESSRFKIELIVDPRAHSLCPLAVSQVPLRGILRYLVRRATRILLRDPQIAEWFEEQSQFISALEDIRLRLM